MDEVDPRTQDEDFDVDNFHESPLTPEPEYGDDEARLVQEYLESTQTRSMSQCTDCVRRLMGISQDQARWKPAIAALCNMASGLVDVAGEGLLKRDLYLGGAIPSPSPAAAAATTATQWKCVLDEFQGSLRLLSGRHSLLELVAATTTSSTSLKRGGPALLMCLLLEYLIVSSTPPEDSAQMKELHPPAVIQALMSHALTVANERSGEFALWCLSQTLRLCVCSTSGKLGVYEDTVADMMIYALQLQQGQMGLWKRLEDFGDGRGGGVGGFVINRDMRLPEELQAERLVPKERTPAEAGVNDAVLEAAEGLWRDSLVLFASPKRRASEPAAGVPGSVLVTLLLRIRRRLAEAKGKVQKAGLARGALRLVQKVGRVGLGAEALGHVLPVCFALMEEYAEEDLMLLGYVLWLGSIDASTPTDLAWHLGINFKILQRCLKVVSRTPYVLRVCIFALSELLKRGRSSEPREADRMRDEVLQEVIGTLARATEQTIRFFCIEGLIRIMKLYSGGFLLVSWLRPLTQVLLTQLEEGNDTTRCAALEALTLMIPCCQPMVTQHAHETLGRVARVYMAIKLERLQTNCSEETLTLCRAVALRLHEACGERADLLKFARDLLVEDGCEAIRGLLDADMLSEADMERPD